jgi:hypothetical protein
MNTCWFFTKEMLKESKKTLFNMPRPTRKSQGLDPVITTTVKATRKQLDAARRNYGSLSACIRYCAEHTPITFEDLNKKR